MVEISKLLKESNKMESDGLAAVQTSLANIKIETAAVSLPSTSKTENPAKRNTLYILN